MSEYVRRANRNVERWQSDENVLEVERLPPEASMAGLEDSTSTPSAPTNPGVDPTFEPCDASIGCGAEYGG